VEDDEAETAWEGSPADEVDEENEGREEGEGPGEGRFGEGSYDASRKIQYGDQEETSTDELGDVVDQLGQATIQDTDDSADQSPEYVDTYLRGRRVCFMYHGYEYETRSKEWIWHERADPGQVTHYCTYRRMA